jgi:hypothetical protein
MSTFNIAQAAGFFDWRDFERVRPMIEQRTAFAIPQITKVVARLGFLRSRAFEFTALRRATYRDLEQH